MKITMKTNNNSINFLRRLKIPMLLFIVCGFTIGCVDTSLKELSISVAPLDQQFQKAQLNYTSSVPYLGIKTTATATTTKPVDSLTINGVLVESGVASPEILLAEGQNTITIIASAGVEQTTYTVDLTRDGASGFVQHSYLKGTLLEDPGTRFGKMLVLKGNTLVVSSLKSGPNGINNDIGIVSILGRSENNSVWTIEDTITPPFLSYCVDCFIAYDENNLAISSDQEGLVYIYHRDSNGTWTQEAVLTSYDGADDLFGGSISMSGDTLAIGARWEDGNGLGVNSGDEADNSANSSGAVYVYTRDSAGNWIKQAYIKASIVGNSFGSNLVLDGDTLAVYAPSEDEQSAVSGRGAVYIFTRDEFDVWSQQAYLKDTSSLLDLNLLGMSLSQDSLALGRISGSQDVLLFERTGDQWQAQPYLTKPPAIDLGDAYGASVAISGNTLVVGAQNEDSAAIGVNGDQTDNNANRSGAAYVFTRDSIGADWAFQFYLKASNTDANDGFGMAVSVDGTTIAVGAPDEASVNGDELNNDGSQSGAVYLFE